MNSQDALEVFDGIMLGDAGLKQNGASYVLSMDLSKGNISGLISYLSCVRDALEDAGIPSCNGHPKVLQGTSRGKLYEYAYLATRSSPILAAEHQRWYHNGKKIAPLDVRVTPRSIAHWFMGDGSSTHDDRYKAVNVSFSTHSYTEADIVILEGKLHRFGLSLGRIHRFYIVEGSGIVISLLQRSVNDFMHMIDPFIVEPYRYKVKYRDN